MLSLFLYNKHKLKIFPDVNVKSSELIQPDITGASSTVPSLQIEITTEKVPYPLSPVTLL